MRRTNGHIFNSVNRIKDIRLLDQIVRISSDSDCPVTLKFQKRLEITASLQDYKVQPVLATDCTEVTSNADNKQSNTPPPQQQQLSQMADASTNFGNAVSSSPFDYILDLSPSPSPSPKSKPHSN